MHSIYVLVHFELLHPPAYVFLQMNHLTSYGGESCSVLFCSLAFLDPRVGHTMDVLSPFIPVLCHSDFDSSTESPVHVLMLSIQAMHGLARLRAPGIVHYIISFSRQLPCFLMV